MPNRIKEYIGIKEVMIGSLPQNTQKQLAQKIEERVFDIANKLIIEIQLTSFNQASMALAIIRYVRREFDLRNNSSGINQIWDDLFNLNNISFLSEYDILKSFFGDPKKSSSPEMKKDPFLKGIDLEQITPRKLYNSDIGKNNMINYLPEISKLNFNPVFESST